ncbi:hypothetical protein FSP39_023969 [Pinctada imbricata]|uniref:Peroxisomal leader peptide-processing protease n=1 Tax=Pinctada imbricata TaxID=66713 RepID=A0AA88YPT0_PINIB|nr:hypothetical protein FSP39_023969 [Pinctada imbricata]
MQDRNQPLVCALSVTAGNKKDEGTCSGILIDSKHGFLLTHASVIASHLPSNSSTIQDMNKSFISMSRRSELAMLNVDIVFPSSIVEISSKVSGKKSKIHPSFSNSINTSNHTVERFTGSIYGVLKVKKLSSALEKLMPENNWEFTEDLKAPDFNKDSQKQKEENFFYKLLPCFLLIRINNWVPFDNLHVYAIKDSNRNFTGDNVEIVGTPFGCINPGVFLNSMSRGIISNTAGKDKVLILTDARCVPGTEGGAMYYRDGRSRILTGIVIATLCWKSSEWVGLSMACGISHILEILYGLQLNLQLPSLKDNIIGAWSGSSMIQDAMRCVPIVTVGGTWGSGVLLWQDADHDIILTCGHVVKDADFRKVHIQYGNGVKRSASVLYRALHNQQFDLAILQCQKSREIIKSAEFGKSREGDAVYVIGYGVFGEEHELEPTVTSGNISKVIHVNKKPVMIQTSCAVHSGASGGPVINQKGEVVGLAVCNAKMDLSNEPKTKKERKKGRSDLDAILPPLEEKEDFDMGMDNLQWRSRSEFCGVKDKGRGKEISRSRSGATSPGEDVIIIPDTPSPIFSRFAGKQMFRDPSIGKSKSSSQTSAATNDRHVSASTSKGDKSPCKKFFTRLMEETRGSPNGVISTVASPDLLRARDRAIDKITNLREKKKQSARHFLDNLYRDSDVDTNSDSPCLEHKREDDRKRDEDPFKLLKIARDKKKRKREERALEETGSNDLTLPPPIRIQHEEDARKHTELRGEAKVKSKEKNSNREAFKIGKFLDLNDQEGASSSASVRQQKKNERVFDPVGRARFFLSQGGRWPSDSESEDDDNVPLREILNTSQERDICSDYESTMNNVTEDDGNCKKERSKHQFQDRDVISSPDKRKSKGKITGNVKSRNDHDTNLMASEYGSSAIPKVNDRNIFHSVMKSGSPKNTNSKSESQMSKTLSLERGSQETYQQNRASSVVATGQSSHTGESVKPRQNSVISISSEDSLIQDDSANLNFLMSDEFSPCPTEQTLKCKISCSFVR